MEEELNQKQKKIFTEFIKIFNNEEKLEALTEFIDLVNNDDLQDGINGIEKINDSESKIKNIFKEIQEIQEDTKKSQKEIDEVYWSIFDIEKEDANESKKLKNIERGVEIALKIQEDYKRFYGYTDPKGSKTQGIITKLDTACEQIEENEQKIDALQEFYKEVFEGKDSDEATEDEGLSLVEFLEKQKSAIESIISNGRENTKKILDEHNKKLEQLYVEKQKEIESLLPGATSAGLANAYRQQREDAEKKIPFWNVTFIISVIIFIVVFVIYLCLSFTDGFDYTSFLRSIPVWIFSGFFTWYSTKQISEYKRIANEYRHKESLSSSYIGFEKAIEESNQEELKNKLLDIAIDAIKINPSDAINPKGELPNISMFEKLIDSLPSDALEKFTDRINKKLSKN